MSNNRKIKNICHHDKDKEGRCRAESDFFYNLLRDLFLNDILVDDLYKEEHNCKEGQYRYALLLFCDEDAMHHGLLIGYFPKSILFRNKHNDDLVVKKPLSVLLKGMPSYSPNIKWESVCDNNMWVLYDGDKLTPIEIYDQSVFIQFDPYKLRLL